MMYKELGGNNVYFLKWFLSRATVEGDHTASPFVALFILLSSMIKDSTLPSDYMWAEIFITPQEGCALARKCCVSLTTIRKFFPDAEDAVALSGMIRGVWYHNSTKLFNLKKPNKAEREDNVLKEVAKLLGLKNVEEDVNSSNNIPDGDFLIKATASYSEIKRDEHGNIVKVCGIDGCTFEGRSCKVNYHQQEAHGRDVFGDGKKVRGVQRMKPTSCK